jgi:hypothetical protein
VPLIRGKPGFALLFTGVYNITLLADLPVNKPIKRKETFMKLKKLVTMTVSVALLCSAGAALAASHKPEPTNVEQARRAELKKFKGASLSYLKAINKFSSIKKAYNDQLISESEEMIKNAKNQGEVAAILEAGRLVAGQRVEKRFGSSNSREERFCLGDFICFGPPRVVCTIIGQRNGECACDSNGCWLT